VAASEQFIIGEQQRTIDERFRLSIPLEMADQLIGENGKDCILAKERPGCLSLWSTELWEEKLRESVELVQLKMQAGKLEGRTQQLQALGRLLSTRHKTVQLAGRGRLVIPEGFREFLAVEPGNEVVVVGAAVCIEIWKPALWYEYINTQVADFTQMLDQLAQ
jgi:MraZ protein